MLTFSGTAVAGWRRKPPEGIPELKLGEEVKVLSTILMTAALIAGIYGMNYRLIPADGESAFGFIFALGLMVLAGAGLLAVFRRRGWI